MKYQLVVAHHGHDAQRLDAMFPRIKVRIVGAGAAVSKHDVWMSIGVKIPLPGPVAAQQIGKRRDGLGVRGSAAAAVVGRAVLDAIAVNVHVGEGASPALDVDDLVGLEVVGAVVEVWGWSCWFLDVIQR